MVQAPSRRDRVRAATIEEIKGTARQLLVDEGPDAVSLRAIGRAMGMTAPALYRYFGSREDLLQHVCGDMFTEIAADIHAAIGQAAQASGGDMTAKMIAACQAFRGWALAHPPEFGLLFGTPLPGLESLRDGPETTRSRCPPTMRSTRACWPSSSATAMRSAPTCRPARYSPSCGAGCGCTAW